VTSLETRPTGRPRSAEADEAIHRAAIELCVEHGFEGLTVEAVAARAGVGKATVYRRHPNRVGLIVAAASDVCGALPEDIDTGSVLDDLRRLAHGIVRTLQSARTRAVLSQIVAGAARNPELRAAQQRFVAGRRAVALVAIRRGIERGELRADTDADLLAELFAAPLFHRAVSLGERVDARYADAVVEAAVRAFAVS
jgi:AcrR family transcriptional regulator